MAMPVRPGARPARIGAGSRQHVHGRSNFPFEETADLDYLYVPSWVALAGRECYSSGRSTESPGRGGLPMEPSRAKGEKAWL
jgi:hypothetical protein